MREERDEDCKGEKTILVSMHARMYDSVCMYGSEFVTHPACLRAPTVADGLKTISAPFIPNIALDEERNLRNREGKSKEKKKRF